MNKPLFSSNGRPAGATRDYPPSTKLKSKPNMEPNKPTGETLSEGSDIPPEQEVIAAEASPVQELFNGLDVEEKMELCSLVKEFERSPEYKEATAATAGTFNMDDMSNGGDDEIA